LLDAYPVFERVEQRELYMTKIAIPSFGVLASCQVLWDNCLPKQYYHNKDMDKP